MSLNDNNEDNPFSFKKFITKKNDTTTTSATATATTSASSLIAANNSDDDDTTAASATTTTTRTKSSSRNNSNPFSFRQFLNETSTQQRRGDVQIEVPPTVLNNVSTDEDDDDEEEENEEIILSHPLPPSISPPPPLLNLTKTNSYLPDFINESIYPGAAASSSSASTTDNPYLVLENIPSPLLLPPPPPLLAPLDNKNSYFDLESTLPTNESNAQLPGYFDLEANLGAAVASGGSSSSIKTFDLNVKPKQQQHSIDYYQRQLIDKQKIIDEQEKRLEQYEKQMNVIKKKEEQETRTLENIILDIEKNLEKTTIRAIEAETLVDKLKTENKALKVQVQSVCNENELLKLSSNSQSNVRQTLTHYSEQLNSAATSGEQLIKQLLGGVDTLKLIAQSLESVGRIQEVVNNETTNK